ncbi:Putative DNA-binding domain-containing protein [Belliella buryatensis]|uniref:Putative DNA-binding domain-containing protein n=1 Tax=Belliella buryatensis TaxID=1500549 RepID=A0A239C4S3_9BACT|nr:ATP-binding protein [Belliella buryatensis]SNS15186.1 Putative DNA-binding domain-containing protein [Belliella buryatensis]
MFLPIKNDDFIKDLLKKKEGQTLDFKKTISDSYKIAKTLIAFANTTGGTIAIGISDHKKIIGVDPEEEIFMIEKASKEFCHPQIHFTIEVYEIDYLEEEQLEEEIYIVLIKIPKTQIKHYLKEKSGKLIAYIRDKDESLPEIEL